MTVDEYNQKIVPKLILTDMRITQLNIHVLDLYNSVSDFETWVKSRDVNEVHSEDLKQLLEKCKEVDDKYMKIVKAVEYALEIVEPGEDWFYKEEKINALEKNSQHYMQKFTGLVNDLFFDYNELAFEAGGTFAWVREAELKKRQQSRE